MLVLVPFACWGQTTTSALQGVLTDPAGAIVVNANIELTEKATARQSRNQTGVAA